MISSVSARATRPPNPQVPSSGESLPFFTLARPVRAGRVFLKFSAVGPKTFASGLACCSGFAASYRLFPGRANYFQLPPKAHRNGADKLIECELYGWLGDAPPKVAHSSKQARSDGGDTSWL